MKRFLLRCSQLIFVMATNASVAAPLPGGFSHSGWYQFELVVLVDTRVEVLESETWPLATAVHYPARWRWLQDPALKAALMTQYQSADVSMSSSGHLLVTPASAVPPPWKPPPSLLTAQEIALIDELMALRLATPAEPDIAAALDTDQLPPPANDDGIRGPLLPFEEAGIIEEAATLSPFESLGLANDDLRGQAPEVNIPYALTVEQVTLTPVTVTARRIPQPATFEKLPLDRLAAGLERYQQQNDDKVVVATSWLQGPDSDALPILVEPHTDSPYPLLQGFIQLVPGDNNWRLGLNLWANTEGQYLPAIFEGTAPPPSPQRVTVLAVQEPVVRATELGAAASLSVSPIENHSSSTMLSADAPLLAQTSTSPTPPIPAQWPWRHVIHIEDTVPLTENRLRYYDHPVVKVLATWRELSWSELYALGATIERE